MIQEMNSRELHRFELVACLHYQIHKGQECLKSRLQTIPNGWRDWRMIDARLGRLIDQLYDTMPLNRVKYMDNLNRNGEIIIRQRQVVKTDEFVTIHVSALKEVVNRAMVGDCTICFLDKPDIKHCALRKALIECAPPVDLNLGDCPYRYVIEHCEEGKYI